MPKSPLEVEELPKPIRSVAEALHRQGRSSRWFTGYDAESRTVALAFQDEVHRVDMTPEAAIELAKAILVASFKARRTVPVVCGTCGGKGAL